MKQKGFGNAGIVLEGQSTEALTPRYHPGLWRRDYGSRSVRDIEEEIKLCGIRARAGEKATLVTVLSILPV